MLEDQSTFFGSVLWGRRNNRGRHPLLIQSYGGIKEIVVPPSSEAQLAVPIPTWEARAGCPTGTYHKLKVVRNNTEFVAKCQGCPSGRYSKSVNLATEQGCIVCPQGSYSSQVGSSFCKSCNAASAEVALCSPPGGNCGPLAAEASLTTRFEGAESAASCVCPRLTYFERRQGRCINCSLGMDCPGGFAPFVVAGSEVAMKASARDTTPMILQGFMVAYRDNDMSLMVFDCPHDLTCGLEKKDSRPAFLPGGDFNEAGMCTMNSEGIGCAVCKDAFFPEKGGCGKCRGIAGQKWSAILCNLFLVTCLCLGVFHKSKKVPGVHTISVGIIISFVQSVSVVVAYGISFPTDVDDGVAKPSKTFEVDLSIIDVPLECILPSGFLARFTLQSLWPLMLFVGFLNIYVFTRIIKFLSLQVWGDKAESPEMLLVFYKDIIDKISWYWPAHQCDIVNAMCMAYNGLFITITKISMSLFKFKEHPGGQYTVHSHPGVLEGSPEWWSAVPISLCCIGILSVGSLSAMLYIVVVAPDRICVDDDFRRKYCSVWNKFDPQTWWFLLVQLSFAVMLNLVPVVIPNIRVQLLCAVTICLCYMLVAFNLKPWKYHLSHVTDIITKLGLIGFILLSMNLDLGKPLKGRGIGMMMVLVVVVPFFTVSLNVIHDLWTSRYYKLANHRRRLNFSQRLADVSQIMASRHILDIRCLAMHLSDNDLEHLDKALDVLAFVTLGLQSAKAGRRRCVPFATERHREGRLEGELIARGANMQHDGRQLLRQLNKILSQDVPDKKQEHKKNVPIHHLKRSWSEISHLTHDVTENILHSKVMSDVPERVRHVFEEMDVDRDGRITREEFAIGFSGLVSCDNGEHPFQSDDLVTLFNFMDVDQSGSLSLLELAQILQEATEPRLPSWHSQEQGFQLQRSPSVERSPDVERLAVEAPPEQPSSQLPLGFGSVPTERLAMGPPLDQPPSIRPLEITREPSEPASLSEQLSSTPPLEPSVPPDRGASGAPLEQLPAIPRLGLPRSAVSDHSSPLPLSPCEIWDQYEQEMMKAKGFELLER